MALEGACTFDTRPIQASLLRHEGRVGLSMPSGTPGPTLIAGHLHAAKYYPHGKSNNGSCGILHVEVGRCRLPQMKSKLQRGVLEMESQLHRRSLIAQGMHPDKV